MRKLLLILALAIFTSAPALAAVNVNVSIGIHVPAYPHLQRIPGYPAYYAPDLRANYFFYDGLYWVYVPDGWYVSPWFDGPWEFVPIDEVPLFVLRIPLRYYGYPPEPFRRWARTEPPRWNLVWGPDWERRHHQWRRWNRNAAPAPAPLPRYQQRYTQSNYPDDAQRRELIQQHYRHTPRDVQVRPQWRAQVGATSTPPAARPGPERRQPQQQPQAQAQRQPQMQSNRPPDTRARDPRPAEREPAQAKGHAPPVHFPPARPEPPRMQAPQQGHPGAAEDRGPPRNLGRDHGSRSNKPDKDDRGDKENRGNKRDEHDQRKNH